MDLKTYSTGIQHVGIPTNDIEATKDFYQKLGFEVIYETKDGDVPVAFLKLGTFVVETYQNNEAVMKVGSVDHLAIDVKDVEEVYAFIKSIVRKSSGIQFIIPSYTKLRELIASITASF